MDFSKYDDDVFKKINLDNMSKIVEFLKSKGCDYIDSILSDYLDILLFEYDEFVSKYNYLNNKYNDKLIDNIRYDMNILEEFYNI